MWKRLGSIGWPFGFAWLSVLMGGELGWAQVPETDDAGDGAAATEMVPGLRWHPGKRHASAFDVWALPLEQRANAPAIVGGLLSDAMVTPDGGLRVRGAGPRDQITFLDGFRIDRPGRLPLAGVSDLSVDLDGLGAGRADVAGAAIRLATPVPAHALRARLDISWIMERPANRGGISLHPRTRGADGMLSGSLGKRVAFVTAVHARRTAFHEFQDPQGEFPTAAGLSDRTAMGLFKVEVKANERHRFEVLAVADASDGENGQLPNVSAMAQPAYAASGLLVGARWVGRLKSGWTASSQLSFQRSLWRESSVLCQHDSDRCRFTPPSTSAFPRAQLWDNWPDHRVRDEQSTDLASTLAWTHDGGRGLVHRARLTSRLRARRTYEAQSVPGDRITASDRSMPISRTDVFTTDPRRGPGHQGWSLFPGRATTSLSAVEYQARFSDRLWLTPGLAFLTSGASGAVVTLSETALAPQLEARWNVTASGHSTLWLSTGWRYSDDLEEHVRAVAGRPFAQTCRLNPVTGAFDAQCVVDGGPEKETLDDLCGQSDRRPDGSCAGSAPLPRTREHAVAWHQQWGTVHVNANLVYRKTDRLSPVEVQSFVGVRGSTAFTALASTPRPPTVIRSTEPVRSRQYVGATVSAAGALRGLGYLLAYTRSTTTDHNGADPTADRVHVMRAIAQHRVAGLGSMSALYRFDSGLPYSYRQFDHNRGAWVRRLPIGRGPGRDPNDPADDVDLRLPGLHQLSLQARLGLQRFVGQHVSLFADVINVLNAQRPNAVDESAPNLGVVTGAQEARLFQFGLTYRH